MAEPRYETYKDSGGNYRWRLIAPNGRKVASSGESFSSQTAAKRAVQTAKRHASKAKLPKPAPRRKPK
ncbi:MAG TPA: YegP family protein [Thermoleophilaceae bacterium]|nr:YegP family protein [Thermoleophilaceae bacterium]